MNAQNLVPFNFKKGQSGNPKGMKPGTKQGIRAHLNRILAKKLPGNVIDMLKAKGLDMDDQTYAEVIAYVLAVKAAEGDLAAARLITDQTEVPMNKDSVMQALGLNGEITENKWSVEIKDANHPSS